MQARANNVDLKCLYQFEEKMTELQLYESKYLRPTLTIQLSFILETV